MEKYKSLTIKQTKQQHGKLLIVNNQQRNVRLWRLCELKIPDKTSAYYGKLYVRKDGREKGRGMFKAYMCYNGNKKQYTDVYQFDTREELEDSVFCSGYDILDDDGHDMWVDVGDMDDFSYDDEPSWQELMQDRYPSCEDGTVFDTPSGF